MGTNELIAALTAVVALFTYLVWRVYCRIAWLTGAMESHSTQFLRLEAAKSVNPDGTPCQVIWWDPDVGAPPTHPAHGEVAEVKRIYLYLPPHLRRDANTLPRRLWRWFSGT